MKEMITKLQGQIKALESIRENGELSFDERHALMSIEIDLEAIVIALKGVEEKAEGEVKETNFELTNNQFNNFIQENNRQFMEQQRLDMENHINIHNMFI